MPGFEILEYQLILLNEMNTVKNKMCIPQYITLWGWKSLQNWCDKHFPVSYITPHFYTKILNQAHTWFLRIDPVRIVSMCVFVCVCVSAPKAINN